MRKIIAALITSLDGLIEGPNGELACILPFTGKVATKGEVDYARFAEGKPCSRM